MTKSRLEVAMRDDRDGPVRWRVVGRSVRGASHRQRQQPNQDAFSGWPEDGPAACAVLAVADGHGSARCPRSAEGARLAVEAAVTVLSRVLLGDDAGGDGQDAELGLASEAIPRRLVEHWRAAVAQHAQQNPMPEPDPNPAELNPGRDPATDLFEVYGTTLLAVAASPAVLLFVQVGDGELLIVTDAGVVHRPMPSDPRLLANVTTSMSAPNAPAEFRAALVDLSDDAPALILATTDGYANAFREDAGFCQVGSDLLKLIRAEGLETVEANLEDWLREASDEGSGDDATLGFLCRGDLAGGDR
jgi:hypothetical protein